MTDQAISFAELGLPDAIVKAVAKVGYEQASPIQAASIPPLLEGRDILGMAQTGTGKTAAFALPLLSKLDVKTKHPQLLILAPTRELAIQVAEACSRYAENLKGFHVLPIYGGQDYGSQLRQLKRGAQVVVGTPGRVMDHMRRGTLKLGNLKALVLDEADEMLRMGFIDDVNWILDNCPEEKQVALFSATMPKEIQRVTEQYLNNPITVKIKAETATVERIEQSYMQVRGHEKLETLTRLLEVEPFTGVIIFVRTKNATAEVAEKLEARGYASAALNGDMSQQLRERAINRLKQQKLDIIVATDVAARGIDVATVSHVINYDIPYDSEAYVHRIGRTGRAGRSGKAVLFITAKETRMLRTIERAIGQKIDKHRLPSSAEISQQRIDQFKEQIQSVLENETLDFFQQLVSECSDQFEKSGSEIAAALAFMAQKDRPLQLPEEKPRREPRESRESRDNREPRDRKERKRSRGNSEDLSDVNWVNYRLDVGREHGVRPGDIVGAIANEAGIDSEYIGRINLHDDYSTVDLPEGMPKEIFHHLKKMRIRQQVSNFSINEDGDQQAEGGERKRRSAKKKPHRGAQPDKRKGKPQRNRNDD
ncbi:DEAD/DEAH box helicase [uncultured Pseudoteredinibacter sp.]|uniref:DEAD/DEAH box helicase n=1 Tax=uncultured Pseudoteredinibacter sp. TaxID=1641701 RepID=UPI00261CAD7A|nr:DEAD/DEAH box helicase [uncultured Pseudoteredinibacter sp.]